MNFTIFSCYRQKNAFARLIIYGFNDSRDHRLGVDFAGRYKNVIINYNYRLKWLHILHSPSSLDPVFRVISNIILWKNILADIVGERVFFMFNVFVCSQVGWNNGWPDLTEPAFVARRIHHQFSNVGSIRCQDSTHETCQ